MKENSETKRKIIIYDKPVIKSHVRHQFFLKRRDEALIKEKELSTGHTPISAINSNEYIIEYNGKVVYINTPIKFFEDLLAAAFEIAKNQENKNLENENLLKTLYQSKKFKSRFKDWPYYSWTKDFKSFVEHLKEESYMYFDDGENQYYFSLFRPLKGTLFNTSILHALTRHFGEFTKYSKAPNFCGSYLYNNFIFNLIDCSVCGEIVKTVNKVNEDKIVNKEKPLHGKFFKVGLYWDNQKKLFMLNTAFLKSKKTKR